MLFFIRDDGNEEFQPLRKGEAVTANRSIERSEECIDEWVQQQTSDSEVREIDRVFHDDGHLARYGGIARDDSTARYRRDCLVSAEAQEEKITVLADLVAALFGQNVCAIFDERNTVLIAERPEPQRICRNAKCVLADDGAGARSNGSSYRWKVKVQCLRIDIDEDWYATTSVDGVRYHDAGVTLDNHFFARSNFQRLQ